MLRYPHIVEQVFDNLDNSELTKCREVSTFWCDFIDNHKNTSIRKITKYIQNSSMQKDEFKELWSTILSKSNVETVQGLAFGVQEFYEDPDELLKEVSALCEPGIFSASCASELRRSKT